MAGAAGDGVFRLGVVELGDKLRVDGLGHFDHQASFIFDGIGVRGEIIALGLWIARVAKFALNAECTFEAVHDDVDLIAGSVLGQGLEVSGCGTRAARPLLLAGRRCAGGRCCGGLGESRCGESEAHGRQKSAQGSSHCVESFRVEVRGDE